MVNKAIILGRLGKDPEMKVFDSGKKKCSFSVATSQKIGENEFTEWHNIDVWGKQAEFCDQFLTRGCEVYVEGSMRTDSYEDRQGVKKQRSYISAQIVRKLTDPLKKDVKSKQEDIEFSF